MTGKLLTVSTLNRDDFAQFGNVISAADAEHYPVNNGTSERFHDLAEIDVLSEHGRPLVSIFQAQPRGLPLELHEMERHPLSSQAFVPLAGQRFLVVVAPSGEFNRDKMRAFITDGSQGVNYRRGVWHHALIALNQASDFLVIDRGGPGENCELVRLEPPAIIQQP